MPQGQLLHTLPEVAFSTFSTAWIQTPRSVLYSPHSPVLLQAQSRGPIPTRRTTKHILAHSQGQGHILDPVYSSAAVLFSSSPPNSLLPGLASSANTQEAATAYNSAVIPPTRGQLPGSICLLVSESLSYLSSSPCSP